jgi:protein-S-isoprenylcysteine O-methyltransferase Ste14
MAPKIASMERTHWWKGTRGEWYVVAQFVLIGLVWLGPRTLAGQPTWAFPLPQAGPIAGGVLMGVGAVLMLAGFLRLGPGLTALPYPNDDGDLVQTGVYALVRHPIYTGLLAAGLGWALFIQGWLTLGYVMLLFVLLDVKARREERWLIEKFAAYATYRQRVRKLIPFVY